MNIDHTITAKATLTAFRPEPQEKYSEIRFFEIASSTDFTLKQLNDRFEPNLFINIKDFIDKKIEALKCYEIEMRIILILDHMKKSSLLQNIEELNQGLNMQKHLR